MTKSIKSLAAGAASILAATDDTVFAEDITTTTKTATGEKVIYSGTERAKALPQTGEQESLLALAGVAILSSPDLTSVRRKCRG